MDVLLRRCPFLARMPQTFLQQTKNSLLGFAQQCPVMMELASKPMAPIMVRALCSSSSSSPFHPNTEDKISASEGKWGKDRNPTLKLHLTFHFNQKLFCLNVGHKQAGESKLPPGHPVPPSGQALASKCPFLAAEMGQKNSSVVRQVNMEFQEDVQEVRTVHKGKISQKM